MFVWQAGVASVDTAERSSFSLSLSLCRCNYCVELINCSHRTHCQQGGGGAEEDGRRKGKEASVAGERKENRRAEVRERRKSGGEGEITGGLVGRRRKSKIRRG